MGVGDVLSLTITSPRRRTSSRRVTDDLLSRGGRWVARESHRLLAEDEEALQGRAAGRRATVCDATMRGVMERSLECEEVCYICTVG